MASQHLKVSYTVGPTMISNKLHVTALKEFNKSLSKHFRELVDEMKLAFPVYFPVNITDGKPDWVPVKVYQTALPMLCRTTNRMFVGEDLCKHPDWININIKFTMDVVIGAQIISLFPEFLQP
jgi:hypothetical protein